MAAAILNQDPPRQKAAGERRGEDDQACYDWLIYWPFLRNESVLFTSDYTSVFYTTSKRLKFTCQPLSLLQPMRTQGETLNPHYAAHSWSLVLVVPVQRFSLEKCGRVGASYLSLKTLILPLLHTTPLVWGLEVPTGTFSGACWVRPSSFPPCSEP